MKRPPPTFRLIYDWFSGGFVRIPFSISSFCSPSFPLPDPVGPVKIRSTLGSFALIFLRSQPWIKNSMYQISYFQSPVWLPRKLKRKSCFWTRMRGLFHGVEFGLFIFLCFWFRLVSVLEIRDCADIEKLGFLYVIGNWESRVWIGVWLKGVVFLVMMSDQDRLARS